MANTVDVYVCVWLVAMRCAEASGSAGVVRELLSRDDEATRRWFASDAKTTGFYS